MPLTENRIECVVSKTAELYAENMRQFPGSMFGSEKLIELLIGREIFAFPYHDCKLGQRLGVREVW